MRKTKRLRALLTAFWVSWVRKVTPRALEESSASSSAIRACGGAKLDLLWGHSLYEMEDVLEQFGPGLERMPDGFTPFKNTVERNCALREPLPAPSMGQLPLPADR